MLVKPMHRAYPGRLSFCNKTGFSNAFFHVLLMSARAPIFLFLLWSVTHHACAASRHTPLISYSPSLSDIRTVFVEQAWRDIDSGGGVPPELLYAVCYTESQYRYPTGDIGPWPYTVYDNRPGAGPRYFASKAQAVDHVMQSLNEGAVSLDIGLCQINLYWHGHRIKEKRGIPTAQSSVVAASFTRDDIDSLFDPVMNVDIAADVLKAFWQESDSLVEAVGYYHNRRPSKKIAYQQTVSSHLGRMYE